MDRSFTNAAVISVSRFVSVTFLCLGIGALAAPRSDAAKKGNEPLRIALIPFENPEQLLDNVQPAIRFLEKEMGEKIRHFITLSYSSAVEALNSAKADISFMSPLPYVLANAQTGAEAILGEIYNGKNYGDCKRFDTGLGWCHGPEGL